MASAILRVYRLSTPVCVYIGLRRVNLGIEGDPEATIFLTRVIIK
jgi:hypothetical protein